MKKAITLLVCICALMLLSFAALGAQETTAKAEQKQTLPQVTDLKFEQSDLASVTFSWNEVKNAQRYYLYHYVDGKEKPEYIGDTTSTKATVNSLESGKTYTFAVRAVKEENGEKIKGKMSDKLITVTVPEGKVTPETKAITSDSITLYWDKLPGASGYKVYYYNREKEKYVSYDNTKSTSMTVKGLEQNTFYSFKIRAYRWVGEALAYGEYSDVYLEATDTADIPRTYAQSAKAYNSQVNALKQKQNMTVYYKKAIDTEFLLCDVENLASTVKNTINLYEGTLNKKYKFVGGKSGKKTPDALFEPYGKQAGIERDDIENFAVKRNDDGYTLRIVIKSEENFFDSDSKDTKTHSYYDNTLSLPQYKTLDTTPLKIKKADSYYSEGSLIFKVHNGAMSVLKIRCSVMSSIDFTVSSLEANTAIVYSLSEDYRIKEE